MRNLVVVLTFVVTGSACAGAGSGQVRPALEFGDDTPDDLRALAGETFADMLEALPAHAPCLAGVTLEGARVLDARARYLPDTGTLRVRIPATAPQLRRSLVHELAHHLEFACDDQASVRPAFLASLGLPADTPWFTGATWEGIPSEQWATAVVEHVLGERDPRSGIFLEPGTLDVLAGWAVDGER